MTLRIRDTLLRGQGCQSLGMTLSELTRALCLLPPTTFHAPVTFNACVTMQMLTTLQWPH